MNNEYLGSRWYKFDFHTHTSASSDYNNPEETEEVVCPHFLVPKK